MNTKNLITRTLSGIVYVALIIGTILLGDFFLIVTVFAIICTLTVYEFHKLTNKQENVNTFTWGGMLGSLLLFAGIFYLDFKNHVKDDLMCCSSSLFSLAIILFSIYFIFIFGIFILEIFRKKTNPINNISYFLLGQIYIVLPFSLMIALKEMNNILLLALFVLIWANDVFAYLIGSLAGKHKLCEHISPQKSWEGFWGGMLGALLAGFIFSKFYADLNLIQWLVFALIIVVFSTLGDLFESLIKRTVGVKDSGNIMPGHGGFLDRLDSVLFAAPATFVYLIILEYT